jgi:hypothetical protein
MACKPHIYIKDHGYAKEFCNKCGGYRGDIEFKGFTVPIADDPSYGPTRSQIANRYWGKKG